MNIRRNIRAIFILDLIFAMAGIYLFWYQAMRLNFQVTSLQLISSFLILVASIAFIVCGLGLVKRKNWARIAHYPLSLVVIKGSAIGLAFTILVWLFISKKETKEYFQIK